VDKQILQSIKVHADRKVLLGYLKSNLLLTTVFDYTRAI